MTTEADLGIAAEPFTYPARPLNGGAWLPSMAERYKGYSFGPKYNGWYALIHIPTRTIFNRHGNRMTIGDEFDKALDVLCPTLDAEAFKWVTAEALCRRHGIGKGALIVLDCIPEPVKFIEVSYQDRYNWMRSVLPVLPILSQPKPNGVYLEHQPAMSPGELWAELQEINTAWHMPANTPFFEGMVAKKLTAPYPIQLRSPDETSSAYVKFRWKF